MTQEASMNAAPVSVLLVDDHAVVREGYRRLLERASGIEVVAEASSAAEAYRAFCRWLPDVVVMDISLPDVSGIEAMRRLLRREAGARILIFSIHDEAIFPDRAYRAGARGYVTKASAPDVLVDAVRTVARGDRFLSPDIAQTVALRAMAGGDDALSALSHREFEIVRLLAHGRSIRQIAATLCLNYKTVANYQSLIKQKLRADTAVDVVRIAMESGLLASDRDCRSARPSPATV
jgi:two-component system invasion response regulator UvrY